MNEMTFKIHEQILDKATLWTVLDGQLPYFLDIGRTLNRNFWKLAPPVNTRPAGGRIPQPCRIFSKAQKTAVDIDKKLSVPSPASI